MGGGGFVGDILGSAIHAVSLGTIDVRDNSAEKAAKAQAAQTQELIAEQKNAEAKEKARATATRRDTHANDTQTVYTTALGAANDESGLKRKKTLLGG